MTFYRVFLDNGIQWCDDKVKRSATAARHAMTMTNGYAVGWQKVDSNTGDVLESGGEIPETTWVAFPDNSKFDRIVHK